MVKTERFTTADGRDAVRYLEADTDLGIAAGSEFLAWDRAYRFDYPALERRPVTEGHARYCAEHGHATHVVNGEQTYLCPRCGDVYALDNRGNVKR